MRTVRNSSRLLLGGGGGHLLWGSWSRGGGCVVSQHALKQTPPAPREQNDWQTGVKT